LQRVVRGERGRRNGVSAARTVERGGGCA